MTQVSTVCLLTSVAYISTKKSFGTLKLTIRIVDRLTAMQRS